MILFADAPDPNLVTAIAGGVGLAVGGLLNAAVGAWTAYRSQRAKDEEVAAGISGRRRSDAIAEQDKIIDRLERQVDSLQKRADKSDSDEAKCREDNARLTERVQQQGEKIAELKTELAEMKQQMRANGLPVGSGLIPAPTPGTTTK